MGRDIAAAFIENGDEVLLTGRNKQKLNAVASELGCDTFVQDVTNADDARNLRKYIEQKYKKLDILVNNAGLMRSRPVETMEPKLFLEVIETNLYGVFLCTHFLLPVLKKSRNALIINVASTSGHRADAGSSAYNASKFGLLGFTEALRKELRPLNIRVSSISPSSIVYDRTPLGGKGIGLNGTDVAKAMVFLANAPGRALFRDLEMWATNP